MYTVTKGVRDSRDRVRVLTLYRVDPKAEDFLYWKRFECGWKQATFDFSI